MKKWIYLSPHLDDAIYSCGGLIHQQAQLGAEVEIWTIFSGQFDPNRLTPFAKDIHNRWGTGLDSIKARRSEDEKACEILGVTPRHFEFRDVIYRFKENGSAEIIEDNDLFRAYDKADDPFMESIQFTLQQAMKKEENMQICAPLSLGGHIDHQIVRRAADKLELDTPLYYFVDFPYIVRTQGQVPNLPKKEFELSESDINFWCKGIALYGSQVSTFWDDVADIHSEIYPYWQKGGGSCLWIREQ